MERKGEGSGEEFRKENGKKVGREVGRKWRMKWEGGVMEVGREVRKEVGGSGHSFLTVESSSKKCPVPFFLYGGQLSHNKLLLNNFEQRRKAVFGKKKHQTEK